MRQIFNVQSTDLLGQFESGDYVQVDVDGHSGAYAIAFGEDSGGGDRYVYLVSNDSLFIGCNNRDYTPEGYRNCYVFDVSQQMSVERFLRRVVAEKHVTICLRSSTTQSPRVDESNVFVNKNYADTTMYTGIKSYHSHHSEEPNQTLKHHSGYKVGVELEVECNSANAYRKCTEIQSNWIYMETDGSLSSRGIEFITIPLRPQDAKKAETWSALIAYLSKYAKSWSKSSCGLHVHIGREILGRTAEQQSETIGKMLFLYHHWLKDCSMNRAIYGRMRGYSDHDAKAPEADAARTLGADVFKSKKLKDTVKKALIDKSSYGRYFDINLSNSATIEFRRGRGSINTARITAVIEYCELICLYAKQATWESICEADFVAYCRKKIAPTSPLARWITNEESCE